MKGIKKGPQRPRYRRSRGGSFMIVVGWKLIVSTKSVILARCSDGFLLRKSIPAPGTPLGQVTDDVIITEREARAWLRVNVWQVAFPAKKVV